MKAISLAEAKVKAAVSQVKSVVEDISFSAAEKTGRAIDPFSARSRIAKDWALEANDPTRLAKSLGKPKESIKAMTSLMYMTCKNCCKETRYFMGQSRAQIPNLFCSQPE